MSRSTTICQIIHTGYWQGAKYLGEHIAKVVFHPDGTTDELPYFSLVPQSDNCETSMNHYTVYKHKGDTMISVSEYRFRTQRGPWLPYEGLSDVSLAMVDEATALIKELENDNWVLSKSYERRYNTPRFEISQVYVLRQKVQHPVQQA